MSRSPRGVADHDHHLAAGHDRASGGRGGELGQRSAAHLLVDLRQLAADGGAPVRAARGDEIRQRRGEPARGLEEDGRAWVVRDPGQAGPALAAGARQEALERPARAGDPRRDERRQHRRRARDRHDGAVLGGPRRDQLAAGVRDERRARVGHEGEVGPAAQVREQLRSARGGVPGVVAHEARGQAVTGEQAARVAGVLGRDQRHAGEDLERPQRDVAEVADRGRHDEETAGGRGPSGGCRGRLGGGGGRFGDDDPFRRGARRGFRLHGRALPGRRRGYR